MEKLTDLKLADRLPKVAEILADAIREEIVNGVLADGERIPTQDDLMEQYRVGRPAVREALRILENEGLVSIQRGNVGGAVVHVPNAKSAARVMGIVLQSRSVPLVDVAAALKLVEPLCAELCARRPDRIETVVPELRGAYEAGLAVVEDDVAVVKQSRRFHEALANCCGNSTITLVVGALEWLWSVHEQAWANTASLSGEFPPRPLRDRGHDEHRQILEYIELGEYSLARDEAARHLETAQLYALSSGERRLVQVTRTPRS